MARQAAAMPTLFKRSDHGSYCFRRVVGTKRTTINTGTSDYSEAKKFLRSYLMRYQQKDARGKSVGDNYVNIDVMRVIRWTGVETTVDVPGRKRKMTIRGFHSLRHSFCSHCAEAGVPKAVVVSIIGSDSSILDRFYTHIGEEAQLAAIEAISGTGSTTPTIKIKRVLEYIASVQNPSQELLEIEKILKA